ncbi:TPA: hypothetical protein DCQ44_03215 [Candidatus Taylorbacteria bacterium]|nr:hypothetical protein [Candidatus Taylorbacteria bacterium]
MVVFVLILPIIILYAIGYRFGSVSWLQFTGTGGIFVRTERSGVEVDVDGTVEKKTGIFQHNFLVADLKPGLHSLVVKSDGYNQWTKKVNVYAEKVTEINPFLIPDKTVLRPLYQYILPGGSVIATTSAVSLKKIPNKLISPDYLAVSKLFASSSSAVIATSSRELFDSAKFDFTKKKGLILKNKLALWQEDKNLFVEWLGDENGLPYYFCSDETCVVKKEIVVNSDISHSDFYIGKDNYVLVALPDGIYVYEIDDRWSAQNKALLIPGKGIDFRVSVNGILYIKNSDGIFTADL